MRALFLRAPLLRLASTACANVRIVVRLSALPDTTSCTFADLP